MKRALVFGSLIGLACSGAASVSADTTSVGNNNFWVSVKIGDAYQLREYAVTAGTSPAATLLNTYQTNTLFTDLQYTETFGGKTLVGVDSLTNNLYMIDTTSGNITTQAAGLGWTPSSVAVTQSGKMMVTSFNSTPGLAWQSYLESWTWNAGSNQWDRVGLKYGATHGDVDVIPGSNNEFIFAQTGNPVDGETLSKITMNWTDNAIANDTLLGKANNYFNPNPEISWNQVTAFNGVAIMDDGTIVAGGYYSNTEILILNPDGTFKILPPIIYGGTRDIAVTGDGSLFAATGLWQPNPWDNPLTNVYFSDLEGTYQFRIELGEGIDLEKLKEEGIIPPDMTLGEYITIGSFTFAHEVVPEPTSLAMLAMGIGGLMLSRRK